MCSENIPITIPLYEAARNGHLNIVEYLVNQIDDIITKKSNIKVLNVWSPFYLRQQEMVILILLNILLIRTQISMKNLKMYSF